MSCRGVSCRRAGNTASLPNNMNVFYLLRRLFQPRRALLLLLPFFSFSALIGIFYYEKNECAYAYPIYALSAYSLAILVVAAVRIVKAVREKWHRSKLAANKNVQLYLSDRTYRARVSLYVGMVLNLLYTVFRIILGIRYASAWFISMAVYYFVLGALRGYLIRSYKRRRGQNELACYRRTARLLFALNVPMCGMVILMIFTDSSFYYPGYVIYLSAFYTFCSLTLSIVNVVRFRKLGSRILSAAKVLNLVASLMSIVGLQTAMLSRFSTQGEMYSRLMNAITGGTVCIAVTAIGIYMLLHSKTVVRGQNAHE